MATKMATKTERLSLLIHLHDHPGALHELLGRFLAHNIDLTHIESRPAQGGDMSFYVDFIGRREDESVAVLLREIQASVNSLTVLDERSVPWFPRHIWELDQIANRTLDAGADLEADHPGFSDQAYRAQRARIEKIAREYRHGQPIPRIDYSTEESSTWKTVYETLRDQHDRFACDEYQQIMAELEEKGLYRPNEVPQSQDISDFLERRTGFRLRPVAGLLNSRDFLNGLAFRVFFSTQYLRHHSRPTYTPEPDVCHELIGHAPMFADPAFADFSQEIGLASLGASEAEIDKLARCYWHSVEFGLIKADGTFKAYGAGLLSSSGELEYACVDRGSHGDTENRPEIKSWEPEDAAEQGFPITEYQPVYFAAESLNHARQTMREHCRNLPRKFYARYVEASQSIWVDRAVKTSDQP